MKLGQTTVQLGKRAGFDDVGHRLGLTTGAQISVCKTPCLSTGSAMPLTGVETVQVLRYDDSDDDIIHSSPTSECLVR